MTGPSPHVSRALDAARLGFLLGTFLLGGCRAGGEMTLRSEAEPSTVLSGRFTTATYSFHDPNNLEVLLIEGPVESPSQVVHLRMHWRPRAARTPADRRATNTTIRYLVFTGEAAGVYTGAGFLFPINRPGGDVFRGELRHTALRLADSSETFVDRLGLASATGAFRVGRDDAGTLRRLRQLQVHLREELGYPRFLEAEPRQGRNASRLVDAGAIRGPASH